MNKTTTREKEPYEAPLVLDIKPVSVVRGDGETAGDGDYGGLIDEG